LIVQALMAAVFASAAVSAAAAGEVAPTPSLKPAVAETTASGTESQIISETDFDALRGALDAASKPRHADALAAAGRIDDPTARDLALWAYFYADDPDVDWRELAAFIDGHPDWPSISRLERLVEKRMPEDVRRGAAAEWFEAHPPSTGEGKLRLARAIDRRDAPRADALVRAAWIEHDWSSLEEKAILREFGDRLRTEDHLDRIDALLWGRRITAAKRMIDLAPDYARRAVETRIALLSGDRNGDQLFAMLPDVERLDGGVMHAAVRYARRDEREPDAIALVLNTPADPAFRRDLDAWWLELRLLARWALKNGRFHDAYALASVHSLPADGPGYVDYADAEFFAGWIALRFLDRPRDADLHFQRLQDAVGSPISLSRAYYWRGRAADAAGDRAGAEVHYASAAAYANTYYGQLAADELGFEAVVPFDLGVDPAEIGAADRRTFASDPLVRALTLLGEAGDVRRYRIFSHHLAANRRDAVEIALLSEMAARFDVHDAGVRAGKYAVRSGLFLPNVVYPLVDVPDQAERYVEPALILGLSRQESEFNPRAYSSAGARGPMQLLPSTAAITARKEGLPYRRSWLLDRPDYNFVVGAAHLSHLLERFEGSYVMTLAAYNAGPHRVDRWIEEYGDPRAPDVDPVDWVELIPFSETRNYVMRVLENTQVYRQRLAASDVRGGRFAARATTSGDLARGGTGGRAGRIAPPTPVLARLALKQSSEGVQPAPPDYGDLARRLAAIDRSRDRARRAGNVKPPAPAAAASPALGPTEPADRVSSPSPAADGAPSPGGPLAYAPGEPQLLLEDESPAAEAGPASDPSAPTPAAERRVPGSDEGCRRLAARADGTIVCLDAPADGECAVAAPESEDAAADAPGDALEDADDLNLRALARLRDARSNDKSPAAGGAPCPPVDADDAGRP